MFLSNPLIVEKGIASEIRHKLVIQKFINEIEKLINQLQITTVFQAVYTK